MAAIFPKSSDRWLRIGGAIFAVTILAAIGLCIYFSYPTVVFDMQLSGFLAWLVWVSIHLMYLVTFQNRLTVFIQWAIQDLTFNRGARLITGVAPTDFNFDREVSGVRSAQEITHR